MRDATGIPNLKVCMFGAQSLKIWKRFGSQIDGL